MDSMPVGKMMPHYSAQDSRLINELLIERRVRIEAEDRNQQFSTLLQRAGQKESYYINKNEKLHQKVKDLKAYGREAHSKCKELCRALEQVEEENKQLKQARHGRAGNVLPKDQAEIQKLTKEVELLRSAHDRIIGEMQQQNSRADWRISELNKQNQALINERKVLKQKIRSLTEKQQTVVQENSNLKNEVLRLKQQLQFQQLKASSVDATSEVSDTETCSMRFSHSSIPNFLQMFEEQSKERQKVREEMQATLDRWTAHNPFSPTVLLGNENRDNGEDTHSSVDEASSSVVEFHGSRDTLDNSLDGLDSSTQDDSLSQVDSVLNRHRTATADTKNLRNDDIKTESVDANSEEKQHEEVTEKKEVVRAPQAFESKKEDSSMNDETARTLLSTAFDGVSLEDLRPGMNLEERLDYVDRLLEKEEMKAAEDQREGLLDFRLLRSVDNDSLMQKVRRNLARIKQAKHGTANDHSSVIEFTQNGYYSRFATPEKDALSTFEFLKTIPTDTEGSAASSPAPTPTPSHPTVSTQKSHPDSEPTIISHTRTASSPVNHAPCNSVIHTRTTSNPVPTPPMIRRNSLTNQLRASTRSTTNQVSRVNSVPSSGKRQHRRTHSADSTLDNTIKIVDCSQKPWTPYRANYRKPAPNATSKRTPDFKALKYQQAQRRNSRHIPLHSSTEDMYKSQSDISVTSVDSNASANSQSQYSVLRKPYRRSFSDDHANQVNGAPKNRVWSVSNECLKVSAPAKAGATNHHQTKASGKKTSGFGSFWPKKESKQPLSNSAGYRKVATDTRLGKGNNDNSSGKQQERHKLSFWKSSPLSKKRQSVVSFTPQQTTISTSNSNMAFESAQTSNNRDVNSRPRSASFTSMQIMEILPPATSISNFSFIGQSNSQLASSPREKLSFSNDTLYETKRVNNMLITNL